VRVLLEGEDGYRVSELEDREIYESVENLYVLDRSQRRLFTLANLLPRARHHEHEGSSAFGTSAQTIRSRGRSANWAQNMISNS